MTWCKYFSEADFSIRKNIDYYHIHRIFFLDLVEKNLLKHWDRENREKNSHFFHKIPTSQKLISQNTFFSCRNLKNMQNWIIISVLLIKAIFLLVNKYIFQLTKYEHKDVCEIVSLTTRICLQLVLRNNHSLNALNFRPL